MKAAIVNSPATDIINSLPANTEFRASVLTELREPPVKRGVPSEDSDVAHLRVKNEILERQNKELTEKLQNAKEVIVAYKEKTEPFLAKFKKLEEMNQKLLERNKELVQENKDLLEIKKAYEAGHEAFNKVYYELMEKNRILKNLRSALEGLEKGE